MTDEEWMQDRVSLRLAPWLDIPVLRGALREFFTECVATWRVERRYSKMFIDDVQEYVDGVRALIPKTEITKRHVGVLCMRLFPECVDDNLFGDAVDLISNRIMQLEPWSTLSRGRE